MKKICALAAAALVLGSCFFTASCDSPKKETVKTCELAVIDTASVYKLQAFISANEKIASARQALEADYGEKMRNASDEQRNELRALFEKDMLAVVNKEMNPLKDRVQASIASVAADKHITVVMDKSIVVTGAEDITDSVKDKFREDGELKTPDYDIGDSSSVAYFDQDVVSALPMFRDANKKMQNEWTKAREAIAEKSKTATQEEIRVMTADYEKKLAALNEQTMVPLLKKVTDTVSDTAKEKGYILVVDKQYVMYGGKNITDVVADKLIGKKTSSETSKESK